MRGFPLATFAFPAVWGHVACGLSLRRDGRVDLVVYAAWLNTEEAKAEHARA